MTELVFRGTFETQNSKLFMDGIEKLFEETNTQFRGQVLQFEVDNYADYEEIKDEEMTEQTSEENDRHSTNGPNEG